VSAPLSIVFDLHHPEQVETLHALRATFQGRSDLEALTPDTFVLHLWPGCARCVEGDETKELQREGAT
jgi:hypothetical protein